MSSGSSVGVARQYVSAGLTAKSADQRAHEEHVVLSVNDFDEPEISQTRPSKILPHAA